MGKQLDFSGRTQLYYQLYDILYNNIISGTYKPGDLLPTEAELMETYHISRITVRKAMDMLMNEGLITKRRGVGTTVQHRKMAQTLSRVLHFANEIESLGYTPSVDMLSNRKVFPTKSVADALSIQESVPLINVKRLRYGDSIPMCIENAFLVYERCPDVLDQDFSKSSLRFFLEKKYNIVWKNAAEKIFSINAPAKIASLLGIKEGDAVFYIERVSYDQNDTPLEYFQGYSRGDYFYLTAELQA